MSLRYVAWRFAPGDDLRRALERSLAGEAYSAGWVSAAVGSLSEARLRFAGCSESSLLTGALELVSLSGTLAPDGLHVHAGVADARGRMSGGHLDYGCTVRTTMEVVCALCIGDLAFRRQHDPHTGYRELVVGLRP